jgi:phosphoserine aminotransferase
MKKIYFTVGPSALYPTVPKHIAQAVKTAIPSLSHRSEAFKTIFKDTVDNLRELLAIPQTHHIYFTTSALEAMERTIQNTVYKHSFHFVNGSFSREFYQIATDLGKKTVRSDAPNGKSFDFDSV